jgi:hypothetical protein
VPKQEKPLNPADGPLPAFACELRALRAAAGLTHRDLARKTHYSHVVFVRATGGRELPSWPVTEHLVIACGAADELERWKQRWDETRNALETMDTGDAPATKASEGQVPTRLPQRGSQLHSEDGEQRQANRPYVPTDGEIRTMADYARALQKVKASVGNPSFHQLARRAGVPASTLADLSNPARRRMDWDTVRLFLGACGVDVPDLRIWRTTLDRAIVSTERLVPAPREPVHSPPPEVDFDTIHTPEDYVLALKNLMRAAGYSWDKLIERARRHPGAWLLGRSALTAKFRLAAATDTLPDRDLVKSFVRGCYCNNPKYQLGCVPDCHADEVQQWLKLYDQLLPGSTTRGRSASVPGSASPAWLRPAIRQHVWLAIAVALLIGVGIGLAIVAFLV